MPVMDGVATVRVLRKLNPELPIIAASGLSANGHTAKVAGLGVKHFLPKPYTAETLLRTLKEALAGVVGGGLSRIAVVLASNAFHGSDSARSTMGISTPQPESVRKNP